MPRRFERDDAIVRARDFILAHGTPTRVLYDESARQRLRFVPIASAMTVDHDHYRADDGRPLQAGDHVALLGTPFRRRWPSWTSR